MLYFLYEFVTYLLILPSIIMYACMSVDKFHLKGYFYCIDKRHTRIERAHTPKGRRSPFSI
jgi:hypothetical protein